MNEAVVKSRRTERLATLYSLAAATCSSKLYLNPCLFDFLRGHHG